MPLTAVSMIEAVKPRRSADDDVRQANVAQVVQSADDPHEVSVDLALVGVETLLQLATLLGDAIELVVVRANDAGGEVAMCEVHGSGPFVVAEIPPR
jgi:hypothetical protein